jgi:hypothetical protein
MEAETFANPDLQANDVQGLEYIVLGVATCYQRDDEGRLTEVNVAEPIPAADLDCLAREVRTTSYSLLYAATYAEVVHDHQPHLPADIFPADVIPGENFIRRAQAATRTYRTKPDFRHLPLHSTCTPEQGVFRLNYNPEPRRIINAPADVSDADNVKQHGHTHKVL